MAATALRYANKTVIVTGGSQGIGLGVTQVFVKNGANVVFCDLPSKADQCTQTAADLSKEGPGKCEFIACDMSQEDQIKNLVDYTAKTFGGIDCLVNNAGIHPPHYSIDEFSSSDFQKVLNVNVMGYFLSSKFALPHLRKSQGNIINNCSLVAQIAQVEAVTYISSKGAVDSMTRALALDEAKYNVRVNSFSPGNVFTPLWEQAAIASPNYDEAIQTGKDAQALGRFGTLEECGLVCLFLAADATFCTGININVTGGAELGYGNKNRTK